MAEAVDELLGLFVDDRVGQDRLDELVEFALNGATRRFQSR